MSTLLEVKDVCKRYGKKTALDHLNLTLESGHIVGLLGPNGSGKTTLIKLINGILTPDEGEILVEGMKIGVETKKVVSYLPDHTYLNMGMRVRDILDYFEDNKKNDHHELCCQKLNDDLPLKELGLIFDENEQKSLKIEEFYKIIDEIFRT